MRYALAPSAVSSLKSRARRRAHGPHLIGQLAQNAGQLSDAHSAGSAAADGADVGAWVGAAQTLHLAGHDPANVGHVSVTQSDGSATPLHSAVGAGVDAVGADDTVGADDGENVGGADGACVGASKKDPARPFASSSSSGETYCAITVVLIDVRSPLEQSGLELKALSTALRSLHASDDPSSHSRSDCGELIAT